MFQHDDARVHKVRYMKTWCTKFSVRELKWPVWSSDLKLTEHLWDAWCPCLSSCGCMNQYTHLCRLSNGSWTMAVLTQEEKGITQY